jgi:hypothetical protein
MTITIETAPYETDEDLDEPIIDHIRLARDNAPTLREMAEWCVEYEEAIGGRPPTRARY